MVDGSGMGSGVKNGIRDEEWVRELGMRVRLGMQVRDLHTVELELGLCLGLGLGVRM